MKLMESAPGNEGMGDMVVTDVILEESYDRGMDHVLNEIEYLRGISRRVTWKVATWSAQIKRSSIEKYGTKEDKDRLPEPTQYNNKHQKRGCF